MDHMDKCGYDAVLLIMAGQMLATSSFADALIRNDRHIKLT